jgi:hypothetical protein
MTNTLADLIARSRRSVASVHFLKTISAPESSTEEGEGAGRLNDAGTQTSPRHAKFSARRAPSPHSEGKEAR